MSGHLYERRDDGDVWCKEREADDYAFVRCPLTVQEIDVLYEILDVAFGYGPESIDCTDIHKDYLLSRVV